MPLETDIDNFVLGEASDGEDRYLFLLDPATEKYVGAAGYYASRRYFECVDLVSDGYGPTLFILLMQKARRDGFQGVAPDLAQNSAEAKRMDARFFYTPPPGVLRIPNPDAQHAETADLALERNLIEGRDAQAVQQRRRQSTAIASFPQLIILLTVRIADRFPGQLAPGW